MWIVDASHNRLHENVVSVSFTVKNTGSTAGYEVRLFKASCSVYHGVWTLTNAPQAPQLYIAFPSSAGEPPNVLRGFDSVHLNPGESKAVQMQLTRYDLSIWDVSSQRWIVPTGTFGVNVGASSRDLRLKGSISH